MLQIGDGTTDGSIDSTSNVVNNSALIFDLAGDRTFAKPISGSGTLTKNGPGALTLSASNTSTGDTKVDAGTLIVGGSLNGTTQVDVAQGAVLQVDGYLNAASTTKVSGRLQGAGSVGAVSVTEGGTFAPGSGSTGTMQVAGLSMAGGSVGSVHFALQVSGTNAGTEYNVVKSTGAVALGNNVANLDVTVSYAPSFTLGDLGGSDKIYFSLGGYASGTFGNVRTGVYDEQYQTTFNEITASNGSVWAVFYGVDHTNSATLSGGGDIALYAIPEPGTWSMFFGGFAMLGLWQRARRRLS